MLEQTKDKSNCTNTEPWGDSRTMPILSVLGEVDFLKSEDKCSELAAGDGIMGPQRSHSLQSRHTLNEGTKTMATSAGGDTRRSGGPGPRGRKDGSTGL